MLKIIITEDFIRIVLAAVSVMAFVGVNGLVLVYMERKLAGHIQRRPVLAGPHTILPVGAGALHTHPLQSLADRR